MRLLDLDDAPVTRFERITRQSKPPRKPERRLRTRAACIEATGSPRKLSGQIRRLARSLGIGVSVRPSQTTETVYMSFYRDRNVCSRVRISDHETKKVSGFITILSHNQEHVTQLVKLVKGAAV